MPKQQMAMAMLCELLNDCCSFNVMLSLWGYLTAGCIRTTKLGDVLGNAKSSQSLRQNKFVFVCFEASGGIELCKDVAQHQARIEMAWCVFCKTHRWTTTTVYEQGISFCHDVACKRRVCLFEVCQCCEVYTFCFHVLQSVCCMQVR